MKYFPTYDTYEVTYRDGLGDIETVQLIAESSYEAVLEVESKVRNSCVLKALPCNEVDYVK